MSETNEAGDSSTAVNPPLGRPDRRTRYEKDSNMDLTTKFTELYKVDQEPVYVKGARGVDPKPYKIHKVLGDGQYKLWRDGECDNKIYLEENLQTEP